MKVDEYTKDGYYRVQDEIEDQAAQIVNEYVKHWPNGGDLSDYNMKHLDAIYYYLIFEYKKGTINIFNYDSSIYSLLFLV